MDALPAYHTTTFGRIATSTPAAACNRASPYHRLYAALATRSPARHALPAPQARAVEACCLALLRDLPAAHRACHGKPHTTLFFILAAHALYANLHTCRRTYTAPLTTLPARYTAPPHARHYRLCGAATHYHPLRHAPWRGGRTDAGGGRLRQHTPAPVQLPSLVGAFWTLRRPLWAGVMDQTLPGGRVLSKFSGVD